ATYALGFSVEEIQQMSMRLWTREVTQHRNRRALLSAIFPKWLGFSERFGTIYDDISMERLRACFGDRTFDDLKIPLYMAATDFHNGDQVVLSSGKLVDAIRASIAIPFVYEPYQIGDRLLID